MMLNHQKFNRLLEQSLSTRDLEDILTRIKKKVSAWQEKCLLCASIATADMKSNIPNLISSHLIPLLPNHFALANELLALSLLICSAQRN